MYGARAVFSRREGKWYIANPANPEDNLADKWNQNPNIPDQFFRWTRCAWADFVEALKKGEDQQFRAMLENSLGQSIVDSILGKKYCGAVAPKPIVPQTAAKPYRSL